MDPWMWLGLCIFIAFGIEAITGFGSIVIALSLGALLLPIDAMLPVLVPLNICMTSYLAIRHRQHIHWPTLLKMILPLMVGGTLLGYLLRPALGDNTLQILFGALVIWFAARELWRSIRGLKVSQHGSGWTRSWMLIAGITHGLFASGGPLLVYALTGTQLSKSAFRATLISVWLSLNGLLTVVFALDGSLLPALPRIGMMLPVLLAGVVIGEFLHHRVNENRFKQLVYTLLLLTGALLIITTL
ncbi:MULTISPECIES: sulfite exporter TauE/SafE family protein [Spongiibacter]|uniref:sulfite exporter TauE/SafE family protein n=1 Tax=Spongiibacter TaxID=630749 RepID=UPI000C699BAF|nr:MULTISPECIES: sulfite exporter TauE/SafE family protein [Spongiibacter]MAY40574.1 permease [Spongiibacter sp.]MBO6752467.1 sulfite exporter TauE/SafE family protein [Spongiibacter sp.]